MVKCHGLPVPNRIKAAVTPIGYAALSVVASDCPENLHSAEEVFDGCTI